MTSFIVVVILLTVAVAALVAIPLVRRKGVAAPAPWAALGVVGTLAIGSALLYGSWSNWSWSSIPAADDPQSMVARLARRLERDPEDLEGWILLGRSYVVLEQFPLAARAYRRADRLANGRNAEALIGLAEAMTGQDEAQLDREAGALIERALALEPSSPRGLFYGAATALRRGELRLARDRFAALLALDPPENVKPVLRQQIANLDREIAAQGETGAAAPAAAANGAAVRVNVALAPALAADVPESAPLFVIVRDPGRPGPPLAVKKLASRFPQSVELTTADALMGGNGFTAGQQVQVIARVARSGTPTAQSGDPFGEVRYDVGNDGLVEIVIDRRTP